MRLLEALPEVLPLAGAVPGTDADAAGLLPADAAGDEVAPPDRLAVAVTDAGAPTVRLLVAVALIELEGVPVRERVPEAEPEGVLVREPEGAGLPLPVAVVDAGAPGDSVLLAVSDMVALRDAVGENEDEPLREGVSLLVGEPEMVLVPEPVAGAVRLAVEVMVAAPLLVGVVEPDAPGDSVLVAAADVVAVANADGVPVGVLLGVREGVPVAEPEGVPVAELVGAGLPLPVAVVDAGAPGDSVLLAVWDTVALRDAVGENEEEPLRVGVSLLVGEPEMVHVPEPVAGAVRLAVEVMVAAPLLVGVADALTAALGVDVMELPPVDAEAEILASGVPAGLIPNDGAIDAATDADAAADAEAATLAVGVSAGLIPTDGAADAATLTRIDPAGVALGESTPGLNKAVGEALGDSPALDAGGGGLAVAELDAAPARGDGDGETSATTWTA